MARTTNWLVRGRAPEVESRLHEACRRGEVEVGAALLESDTSLVHALNGSLESPLVVAAAAGQAEMARLCLDNGADMACGLSTAAAFGHTEVVEVLLERGADVQEVSAFGASPLAVACEKGFGEVAAALLRHGAFLEDEIPATALARACVGGHADVVALLLEQGADPDARGSNGRSPLFAACVGGRLDIVDALLDGGADVRLRDFRGETALFASVRHPLIAARLLAAGASATVENLRRERPLHAAARRGAPQVVSRLLLQDASAVNLASSSGQFTPLCLACARCDSRGATVAELLLAHNADIRRDAVANPASILYVLHHNGWLNGLDWLPYADPYHRVADGVTALDLALNSNPRLFFALRENAFFF